MTLLFKRRLPAGDIIKYYNYSTQHNIQKSEDLSRRVVTCRWRFGLHTLQAFWVHHALHVALHGLPARHSQCHEDIPQPPVGRLGCSCPWSPHLGTVGLCPAGEPCQPRSPSTPTPLLRGSLPLLQPDRRIVQQSNSQEKLVSILRMLFLDRSHSDLEESRLKGPFAFPSQAADVFTIVPRKTGGQEQQERSTAAL